MSTDVAIEILRDRYGLTGPVTVHETWGASIVVEIDDLFLKANGDRSTVAETIVAQRVRAAGVPAPEIINSGTDPRLPGGTWIVMPRMPGLSVGSALDHAATAIADIARYLGIMRDTTLPGWGRVGDDGRGTSPSWADWLRRQITQAADRLGDRLPDNFVGLAMRFVDEVAPDPTRGSVLNGDLGLSHVLVEPATGEVTGILDWADAIIGDPLFDVATFSMGGPGGDPIQQKLQPLLLEAYGADPDDPRIGLYRAIDHLANAVWSIDNDILSWTDGLCDAAVELVGQRNNCTNQP